jgi:electron transport complex protein RnfB
MVAGLLLLALLTGLLGLVLVVSARRIPADAITVVDRLDSVLPHTQCGRCGYSGCRPYAAAIAAGKADINQCPPGGDEVIVALSQLLGRPAKALDESFGLAGPPIVAVVDEDICIGCARCLDACPVDAILGAAKFSHTVIENECTGCELCIPACPVDCITVTENTSQLDARAAH